MLWSDEQSTHWRFFLETFIPERTGDHAERLLESFRKLYELVLEGNKITNLTRITEPDAFFYRQILDSLLLLPFIPQGAKVADVGSGPGFPAIPLALVREDIHVTAIEATGKKTRFIEQAREALGLSERLTVVQGRAEELAQNKPYRDSFDIVTARALAALPTLLELTLPMVHEEGLFLALKGENYREELEQSEQALSILHGELEDVRTASELIDIPALSGTVILVFAKTGPTPAKYPRPGTQLFKKSP